MRIFCDDWREALSFFLEERNVERMRKVGLYVVQMDWQNKCVHLGCEDDERYAEIISQLGEIAWLSGELSEEELNVVALEISNADAISEAETVANPFDGVASNRITS